MTRRKTTEREMLLICYDWFDDIAKTCEKLISDHTITNNFAIRMKAKTAKKILETFLKNQ